MKSPDWIALLEASYDLAPPDTDSWLRGVLKQVACFFEDDLPIGLMVARHTPHTFEITNFRNAGPVDLTAAITALHAQASPEFLAWVYQGGIQAGSFSELVFPKFPEMRERMIGALPGVRDVLGFVGHTGTNYVVTFSAPSRNVTSLTALARRRWPQAASHLAAGLRLRLSLGRALESPQVEAVLEPSGRTQDAKPATQSAQTRDLLRRAVQRIDRARSQVGRKDVAASLEAWQGLLEGRWSLVDHFDSDGKRFVLAVKNDPEHPDPRGLTPQQRQSTEFLGLGHSTKGIAYTLGISEAAVSGHLTEARLKLGLRSRSELAGFFAPSGARARLAEVGVAGEQLLVGAYPLCDERHVAQLTAAEREIAALLLRGSTNQDIASHRRTSVRTIANQVQAIFRKLGVRSRVELATRLQASN